jgi:hypothetical protein
MNSSNDGTVLAASGNWSITTDGLQWILRKQRTLPNQRTGKPKWDALSFVHSTKNILARCMREKGCPAEDAAQLLAACPERFSPPKVPAVPQTAQTTPAATKEPVGRP